MFYRSTILAILVLLSGCGGLPRPFEGRPGLNALRLAQPPAPRLLVIRPDEALLPNAAADSFPAVLADALKAQDVPAVSGAPLAGDWRLVTTAELQGSQVVPFFKVLDATGEQVGIQQGDPVPADKWANAAPAEPAPPEAPFATSPPPPSAPAHPSTLTNVAGGAARGIADLLTRIDAARRASDPNSLVNRQARMQVPDVTGAPGDGNRQLARNMRNQLADQGLLVQDAPGDFTVAGHVAAVPIAGDMTRIEIQWVVSDARGAERGRIIQLNEVKAGSLDRFWGDVAMVVAQEAASGVKDVVTRQAGASPK